MHRHLSKKYCSYYFTIRSPLFSPFNSLNLFLHFKRMEGNNSTNGYYLLSVYEQCETEKHNDNYCHKSVPPFLNKNILRETTIKKIASA